MPLPNVEPLHLPPSGPGSLWTHAGHQDCSTHSQGLEATDEYCGYRMAYQLDRFTAGYRTLVVFYLAM